jgi:hypothetical protein
MHNLTVRVMLSKACLDGSKHSVSVSDLCLLLWNVGRWQSDAISIAVEHDTSMLTRGTLVRLDPLARPHRCPHAFQESKTASSCVATVVTAHDRLDRLGRLVCMVEWDRADVVV